MKIIDTTRRRFAIVLAAVIVASCSKTAPTTPSPPASPQPPAVAPSPTLVVTGRNPVFAGSPMGLTFRATDSTAFTLNVDYGDGSADSRSKPAAGVLTFETMHTYRNSGEYVVSGTVTDDAGGRAMVSTKVVVLAR